MGDVSVQELFAAHGIEASVNDDLEDFLQTDGFHRDLCVGVF
jgi:hypothetical protein